MPRIVLNRNNTNFTNKLHEYMKSLNTGDNTTWGFLKKYQNVVRHFLNDIDIGARGLLLYHDMGVGKSISAIAIAIDLMNKYPPIILLAKSLQTNFYKNILKYIQLRTEHDELYMMGKLPQADIDRYIKKHFSFVSLNAGNMIEQMAKTANGDFGADFDRALSNKIDKIISFGTLDNKLLIIDEAHNLFRAVTNGSKNAITLYNMIIEAKNLKLILLTGTPITNNPFELSICFNMLAGTPGAPILNDNYQDFYKNFISNGNIINKYKFQNRIIGLVSRVSMKTGELIPKTIPLKLLFVPMHKNQYTAYLLARDKEMEETSRIHVQFQSTPSLQKPHQQHNSSYRVRSRQTSNFDPKNVEESPKMHELLDQLIKSPGTNLVYSQFIGSGGLKSIEHNLIRAGWKKYQSEGPKIKRATVAGGEEIESKHKRIGPNRLMINRKKYKIGPPPPPPRMLPPQSLSRPLENVISFDLSIRKIRAGADLKKLNINKKPKYPFEMYVVEHHAIQTKILAAYFEIKYDDEFIELMAVKIFEPYQNINLEHLIFYKILDILEMSFLNTLIYKCRGDCQPYIKMGMIRAPEGYLTYTHTLGGGGSSTTFAIITGEHDIKTRQHVQNAFNSPENKNGAIINTLLVSSIGAEGLDLKNVRRVHIFEPYWNYGRINQIIARAVRINSHIDLPEAQRTVEPFIYLGVKPTDEKKELSRGDWTIPDAKLRTTDEELLAESLTAQVLIDKFLALLDGVAIECVGDGKCITCNPNNVPLFVDDIELDMLEDTNPCKCKKEMEILVNEIVINDGTKYYFKANNKSAFGLSIFEYSIPLGGYVEIPEDDERFQSIFEAIKNLAN